MKTARLRSLGMLASLMLILFFVLSVSVKAVAPMDETTNTDEANEIAEGEDEEETHNLVDITVELEDTSRFMGVAVYRIGDYVDGDFTYVTPYRDLVNYDYFEVLKENTKESHVLKISEYIQDNELPYDYLIKVVNGTGKIEGLEPGLFLLIQDEKSDFNAQLKKTVLIEGPTYDSVTKEDLFDIRSYPQWEKTTWFTFRPEVARPLSIAILLLSCVLLCILGTRSVKFVIFLIPFSAVGMLSLVLSEFAEFKFLEMMLVYVLAGFIGVGFSYLLLNTFRTIFKNTGFLSFLNKNSFWITTLIGAPAGAFIVYKLVSQNMIFYAVIPGVFFVFGFIWQLVNRKKIPQFHNYEDLISLPYPEVKEIQGGEINE